MKKSDIAAHLRDNPQAAKYAESIKQIGVTLRGLRDAGISSKGYTLVEPYAGRGSLSNTPKVGSRARLRVFSK